ncbi:DDE Tnp IS1595 domain-containing protein [Aphis craccivora]|uniref:DDE Tnp IS1595 domain-containing protein n=1 Tax=Aphis craccivora TaxID=307492 RepID=A0A6G0YEW5_APHCR|nr:DDE Tnp IS1595 domain-containing protein [Aphis craccivora]
MYKTQLNNFVRLLKAYKNLQQEEFQHKTVNHDSYNFINPKTGAHTQDVDRL